MRILGRAPGRRRDRCDCRVGWLVAAGICGLVVAGCGKPGPQVQYVEGMVLLDGEPVADATVVFVPQAADGLTATGRSKADGRFTLTSVRGGKPNGGALAGDYSVTFTKADYDLKKAGKTRDDDLDGVPLIYFIPQRYGDAEKSGLSATVGKGQNTGPEFRFELVSDGKK